MTSPDTIHERTDIVRASLEAMPRAGRMAAAALDSCAVKDRKVMSSQDFVIAVRRDVDNISRWAEARGEALSDEVCAFRDATDEELIALQKQCHFSGVQLIEWMGEIKMQLFEVQRTSH